MAERFIAARFPWMRSLVLIALGVPVIATLILMSSSSVNSQGVDAYVPGEVLVRFKSEVSDLDRLSVRANLAAVRRQTFLSGTEHWKLPSHTTVEDALWSLRDDPLVEYAEPNSIGFLMTHNEPSIPVDAYFLNGSQWNLEANRLNAEEAWVHITVGDPNIVVAVPDDGVDYNHEDLAGNMWINAGEDLNANGVVDGTDTCPIPNGDFNCVDDDGNSYTDDIRGWNFADNNNDPSGGGRTHGTQIAGVIGAVSNNYLPEPDRGLAGISWVGKIMPLRITLNPETLWLSTATEAVDYAVLMGAHVISVSWGFTCVELTNTCHQTLKDAMANARDRDVLIVAAAGNEKIDIDTPNNWLNPPGFDLDNIIGVAGTSMSDEIWTLSHPVLTIGSNYGPVSVDIAAPAEFICTTLDGDQYTKFCTNPLLTGFNGTSAAAPHVAGVAALIKALNHQIPFELTKQQLLEPSSVDLIPDFDPNGNYPIVTGGRVNAFKAVNDFDPNAPTAITDLVGTGSGNGSFSIGWSSTGDDGLVGSATLYQVRTSTTSINTGNWLSATRAGNEPTPDPNAGMSESMTVSNLSPGTDYYVGLKAFDEWGNGPLSNIITCKTRGGCTSSFCKLQFGEGVKCTFNGNYGSGCDGCCQYSCVFDETCGSADPCPSNACASACN